MNYAIYDLTTSAILMSGNCDQESAEARVKPGQGLLDTGEVSSLKRGHRIVDGVLVLEAPSAAAESAELQQALRVKRNSLLCSSDWTQMADVPLTGPEKAAWIDYRRSLRDLPTATTDITDVSEVVWPTPPG